MSLPSVQLCLTPLPPQLGPFQVETSHNDPKTHFLYVHPLFLGVEDGGRDTHGYKLMRFV